MKIDENKINENENRQQWPGVDQKVAVCVYTLALDFKTNIFFDSPAVVHNVWIVSNVSEATQRECTIQ